MRLAICFLLCPLWWAADARGQRVVEVSSVAQCPGCRIRIAPLITLTDGDGQGSLALPNTLAIDGERRILVVSNVAPAQIAVYRDSGRLMRVVGRRGSGPGEFERIGLVVVRGDTINVFDSQLNRWTQLDAAYRLIRTVQIPASPGRAVFSGGNLIMNARISTPALAGYPIHTVSSTGTVVGSHGYDELTYRTDIPYSDARAMTACPDGTVWWAGKREYRVEGMSPRNGSISVSRTVSWFRPHVSRPMYTLEAGPPPPLLMEIMCDDSNRLWTVTSVADNNWKTAGLRRPDVDYHGTNWEDTFDPDKYFDTMIEVIEPGTGKLLASTRTDRWYPYLLSPGYLGAYNERDGIPMLSLWHLSLDVGSPLKGDRQ